MIKSLVDESTKLAERLQRPIICTYIIYSRHIGRLARMSVLDTEVDGSNPGSSMLFP